MTREELQPRLNQTYQRPAWLDTLKAVLPATQLFAQPQAVPVEPKSAKAMHQLGRVRLQGGRQPAVLEIEVAESIDLVRNRAGLRSMVSRIIDQAEYHGVLAVFISHEQDFRFTFAARESFFDDEGQIQRRETAARRFTYVLGPNESCRTAAERFSELAGKAHDATLEDVIAAFSVEKLNKEFFADFIRNFEKVAADIRKRHRWPEPVVQAEAQMLLNRLLFLYFVQRKGWLNRQRDYLVRNFREHYAAAPEGTSFYTQFLRPLFQRLWSLAEVSSSPFKLSRFFNQFATSWLIST
jgi:adenine-specific DNA-methyltransferase